MAERWHAELRRLRTLEPGPELGERANEGPRLDLGRDRAPLKAVAAVVAIAILAAAAYGTWRAFAPLGPRGDVAGEGGRWFQLPPVAGSPGDDPDGGAHLLVRTALPDGTIVVYQYRDVDGFGHGTTGAVASNGAIRLAIPNPSCATPGQGGTGFDLTLAVAPVYDEAFVLAAHVGPDSPRSTAPFGSRQPRAVLARLGPRFDRLSGANVVTSSGDHALTVLGAYDWPSDSCARARAR
jgi:hypothetical protein